MICNRDGIAGVIIVSLTIVCFNNSLYGEFVFDDAEAIVNNKDVVNDALYTEIFQHDFWGNNIKSNKSHKSYRPLTILTFRFNYYLAEGLYPFVFHLTNLFLHSLCCWLFYKVCFKLFWLFGNDSKHKNKGFRGEYSVSLISAVLFTVHPVHTECVVGIVGRAELLCASCVLLALICYINSIGYSSVWWLLPVPVLTALGILCKEQAITVLGLCICLDSQIAIRSFTALKERWKDKNFQLRHVILIATGVILTYFRAAVSNFEAPSFKTVENPHSYMDNHLLRVVNYFYLWSLNAWLLLVPSWLCFDWSMGCVPLIQGFTDVRLCSPLLLFAILALLLRSCFTQTIIIQKQLVLCSLMVMVVTFLPSCHLFVRVGFVVAERVLYLPSMGYCLLLTVSGHYLYSYVNDKLKQIVCFCFTILLGIMILRTTKRSYEWTEDILLYKSAIQVCPLNAKVHYNIGRVSADKGWNDEAFESYHKAIMLYPDYEQALNNLGNLYKDTGNFIQAKKYLQSATETNPEFAAAWMNLGIVQAELNDTDNAEISYKKALEFRKKYADCYYNLGNLYKDTTDYPKALHSWNEAVKLKPTHQAAWLNMILLLDNLGRYTDVELVGKEAVRYNPDSHNLHFNIAASMGRADKFDASEYHFKQALALQPNNPDYHCNLGILYHRAGQYKKAVNLYNQALRIDPHHKQSLSSRQMLQSKV